MGYTEVLQGKRLERTADKEQSISTAGFIFYAWVTEWSCLSRLLAVVMSCRCKEFANCFSPVLNRRYVGIIRRQSFVFITP